MHQLRPKLVPSLQIIAQTMYYIEVQGASLKWNEMRKNDLFKRSLVLLHKQQSHNFDADVMDIAIRLALLLSKKDLRHGATAFFRKYKVNIATLYR